MKKLIRIDGMNCEHCIAAVKKNLSNLNLKSNEVKLGSAEVELDESEVSEKSIRDSIDDAGYKVISIETIS
jgi:copper chaperone